jgi:predicted enzyme related to lactoylglutathione lyase
MAKHRTGDPWMPSAEYGRALPAVTINLLVIDIARSVAFYRDVLLAEVRYADPDFAALRLGTLDFMLHADHTYEVHPWHARLVAREGRGLGAELRLFGVDPDASAARASASGGRVLAAPEDKPHGWREAWIEDPDGYVWAVGVATR